jgi:SsrA-binding protein
MQSLIINKKVAFNYEVLTRYEAGVVLNGYEVKALRAGKAHLNSAYVLIRNGEVFLRNAYIAYFQEANTPKHYHPERERKLLIKKTEIKEIEKKLNTAGLTLVPIKWYNKKRNIKIEIALVRGKKKADKRQDIKKRDVKREIERTLKSH